jgi:hypothetical protein
MIITDEVPLSVILSLNLPCKLKGSTSLRSEIKAGQIADESLFATLPKFLISFFPRERRGMEKESFIININLLHHHHLLPSPPTKLKRESFWRF